MSFMLKLPDERGVQLHRIAEAKNTTIGDLIADYIRAEVAAGTITSEVPGIEVTKTGPEIVVKARDGFEVKIPLGEGPTLADLLRESGELTPSDPERKARWLEGLGALTGVKVKRMGAGVRLVSPITGKEYPLASGVAADLAAEIEREAK